MKRYVTEFAKDLIAAEARMIEYANEFGYITDRIVFEKRIARMREIIEQCKYGYIPSTTAVELLVNVEKEIGFD